MTQLSIPERLWVARLSADRLRRTALSRALHAPPFKWRYAVGGAGQLILVPQDLRTTDPSFWEEVALGQFGLAGTTVAVGRSSPFAVAAPNADWARALHGFGWLSHLEASGSQEAGEAARRLATDWAVCHRGGAGIAWEPAVMGRRVISWLSHSSLLLSHADAATYAAITESLGLQLVRLASSWRNAPGGYPRLLALSGLTLAHLSIAGHERQIDETARTLGAELSRQILADGGHISRNPGVLVEIMLDLLPLRQCFAARGRKPPRTLGAVMARMLAMLKYMRMGDGMLARFNGQSVPSPAGLATVLAYDSEPAKPISGLSPSRYVRLERGESILIMDAGRPPPLEAATEAHAGCLSFEFSSGARLIFVNGGAPGGSGGDAWRAAARATANHNTLTLGEKSSSKLIRNGALESLLGAQPIRFPNGVAARIEAHGGGLEVTAHHDGYLRRFRLFHRRTLALSETGRLLSGIDRLDSARGNLRLRRDLPFAIHFHLHPDVSCRRGRDPNTADIVLDTGEVWRFSLEGAELSVEDSSFFADSAGARRALQIVARGATFGESEVRWVMES